MSGSDRKTRLLKIIVFIWPIAFVLFCVYMKIYYQSTFRNMLKEDAMIENLTCVAFLVGAGFALSVARRFFKSHHAVYGSLYVVAFLFLFFVGMEEISWGQRIFHARTPEYLIERNQQEETNVHNLYGLHAVMSSAYYLIGFIGMCSWVLLHFRKVKNLGIKLKYFIPDWYLSLYFFFSFSIAFYLKVATSMGWLGFLDWRDTEAGEMLMSFGFCLFMVAARNRLFQEVRSEQAALETTFPDLQAGICEAEVTLDRHRERDRGRPVLTVQSSASDQ